MDISNVDLLFDNNPNPMWIYDPDSYKIMAVNKAAIEKYGYDREEFTSLTIKDLRPMSEVSRLRKVVEEREEGLNEAGIWRHQKKDAEIIYVRVTSHPIKVSGEKLKLVVVHDVTKEVELENRYLKEKELLTLITEKLPGTFFIFDKQLQFLRWNKRMEEITGYSGSEVKDQSVLDYFEKEEAEQITGAIQQVFEKGSVEIESEIVRKDGDKIPILFNASKVKYNNEECVVGIGIDITNLKELLKQKEVLLTEIHHRVKNNLAVISGLLEVEQEEVLEGKVNNVLAKTQVRIKAMALIYELLYEGKDIRNIRFDKHINNFIETIGYDFTTEELDINVKTGEVNLNINQALPFSLLLNEILYVILANIEHNDGEKEFKMRLKEQNEIIKFDLWTDHKFSSPEVENWKLIKNHDLVNVFARQLEADIDIQHNGLTNLSIEFVKKSTKGSAATVDIDLDS